MLTPFEGENTIAMDFRQTMDTSFPAAITGSGVYKKDEEKLIFHFNRDKNPISTIVSWNFENNASMMVGYNNNPVEFDNAVSLRYNITWTCRRTTTGIIAG